ncbi:hypothetical protein PSTG_08336 [Puccinia striiformis f. sp. tritici PST-78]|uniref:MT-A70-domain-containing protein n=1 Tax=Puccinia striiformis f. sp. tritici PST-78 TaxID=1165861 RepID=A0A0L0VGK6_9BASI|nr:hypothetical protein PSTG_08336 [Puccinia striiformis f. sp. tritici PST-78]
MPQIEPSSVLLEVLLPGSNHTAYLLDPFIPLLRGFDETTRVTVSRPPSEPYIACTPSNSKTTSTTAAISDRECQPNKRQRLNNEQVSSEPSRHTGFSGKASQSLPLDGIQLEAAHHASLKSDIQAAINAIRKAWIEKCSENQHTEWWSDPVRLRHPALARLEWLSSPEITKIPDFWFDWASLTRSSIDVRKTQLDAIRLSEFGTTCSNPSSTQIGQTFLNEKKCTITIPKRSGFSLATMENFKNEVIGLNHSAGWDAVIVDPPWQNKSATRGGKYKTVELYDLFKLDLPGMLGENGGKKALIAIWVTNRPKFRRFLKQKFMPDCDILGPYSEWYWVKITGSPTKTDHESVLSDGGKPLFDLESTSPRRCYEGLILGWYIPPSLRPNPTLDELPPKIFLSVPLGHSRKPNIIDLLEPHLPSDPSILELFSRSVSGLTSLERQSETNPGVPVMKGIWHSVGDESPKFMVSPWVEYLSSTNDDQSHSCDPK